jgi:hypothetical protein
MVPVTNVVSTGLLVTAHSACSRVLQLHIDGLEAATDHEGAVIDDYGGEPLNASDTLTVGCRRTQVHTSQPINQPIRHSIKKSIN